jgi:hypothetical protein
MNNNIPSIEERLHAYRLLPDTAKEKYGSLNINNFHQTGPKDEAFTVEQESAIIDLGGDLILGLVENQDISNRLSGINLPQNIRVGVESALNRLLSNLTVDAPIPKITSTTREGFTLDSKENEVAQPALGTVPDASNDLKERLELRPKNVIRQSFAEPKVDESDEEDDGPKPLTRTQILQSLTSKRTMASDIASIHNSNDSGKEENTH